MDARGLDERLRAAATTLERRSRPVSAAEAMERRPGRAGRPRPAARPLVVAAVVLVIVGMAVAMVRWSGDDRIETGPAAPGDDARSLAVQRVETQLAAARRAAEQDGMSEGFAAQIRMLEDGVVTPAEYRQAMTAGRECMLRAGLEVTPMTEQPTYWGTQLGFHIEPGLVPPAQALDVADACDREFSTFVAVAWSGQEGVTIRPEVKAALDACYEAAGFDTTAAQHLEEYRELVGAEAWVEHDCLREVIEVLFAEPEPG